MQVIAGTLDDERHFFSQVPARARGGIGFQELHIDIDAALRRIHALVDDVLDKAVSGPLHRHFMRFHDILAGLVVLAELFRSLERLGVKIRGDIGLGSLPFSLVCE